jgi:hypothetical protein
LCVRCVGIVTAGVLGFAACGTARDGTLSPQAGTSAVLSAVASAGQSTGETPPRVSVDAKHVPPGGGSTRPDDINGDDYPDAVIISEWARDVRFLTVLYGARDGLNPDRRTSVDTGSRGPWFYGSSWQARHPDTADLDGDGFADIPVLLDAGGVWRPALRIIWGGPRGPQAGGLSPKVPVPYAEHVTDWPVVGDFDGDSHADLAFGIPDMVGLSQGRYAVLYGPFGRNGKPSRTFTWPSPKIGSSGWRLGWIFADKIRPGRRTGLIIHAGDDGEQTGAVVMPQVPSDQAHQLGPGNAIATGDFDGDGRRDVAVGDDGSRNDEPGYEKLGATNAITIYYGRAPKTPKVIRVPGIRGQLVAGDVDGDGRDDLMFQADGRVRLRTKGLAASRMLGPFSCPKDKFKQSARAEVMTAGDYDRDGRAEVLINCWTSVKGPGLHRWWVWDADRPTITFTTSTFTT